MEKLNYANTFELKDEETESTENGDNKKPLLIFSKLNKYFLIPFLCPIFYTISIYFRLLIKDSKVITKIVFLDTIFIDLAYILTGLFYFIPYFNINLNKNNISYLNIQRNNPEVIYHDNKIQNDKNNTFKIIMLIILLILQAVIVDFLYNFVDGKNVFEERIYYIFLFPLFSKIILKENLYKHQYFSLIISICGIIFLFIPVYLVLSREDIVPNIFNIIIVILYSIYLVIYKYMIEKYYISPLKISLIIGINILAFDGIVYIIYSLILYNDLSYFNNFLDFSQDENKIKISIYIILSFLFFVIFRFFLLISLFYFSPTLLIITDIISPFILRILNLIINGGSIPDDILYPIGYLIIFFSSLIYNEIIIFNFCAFNKNTKKFVNVRLYKELDMIKIDQEELLSNKDD